MGHIFRFWALKRARVGGTDLSKSYGINPFPPGRYIYLTYRRFRLYLKTKRFPLRYTHLQRRLYRTRITQRRLRFLRLRLITRLLLLRLLLLLVLLLLRFRRRLRRRLLRCLLRFRRNRPLVCCLRTLQAFLSPGQEMDSARDCKYKFSINLVKKKPEYGTNPVN